MKSKDLIIGEVYLVKISGKLQKVKLIGISSLGGWIAINLATNRQIRCRNGARLRPLPSTTKA